MAKPDITFDFLNSINSSKEDKMTEENEKQYVPYKINHFLSGVMDAVIDANDMNCNSFLDKRLQYDYLRHSLRRKKRYAKWVKAEKLEYLECVMKYFDYSSARAKEVLNILTDEQLTEIKQKTDIGGSI